MFAEGHAADPVFCTRTGNYIGKSAFLKYSFEPLLLLAKVRRVRFHSLRHFHATSLISKGFSIKA